MGEESYEPTHEEMLEIVHSCQNVTAIEVEYTTDKDRYEVGDGEDDPVALGFTRFGIPTKFRVIAVYDTWTKFVDYIEENNVLRFETHAAKVEEKG